MNSTLQALLANPNIQIGKRGEALDLRHFHRYTDNRYRQPEPQVEQQIVDKPKKKAEDLEPESFEELIDEVRSMGKKPKINKLRKMFKSVMDKINEDE